jgi:hypothetical protein
MSIESVGPVDPVLHYELVDRAAPAARAEHTDSVEISAEAQSASEALRIATEIALNSPDLRTELVAEAVRKLQDPSYVNAEVLDSLTDRLMESFGV